MEHGIYTISDFLTHDELDAYIETVRSPPEDSDAFTSSGYFRNFKVIRQELADVFFKRLLQFQTQDRGRPFLRANHYVMAGHYQVGGKFGLHTDTGLYYNSLTKEASRWTLLIYLNDTFKGGGTTFFTDEGERILTVQPKAGTAVLFDIDRWHMGEPLTEGEKLWIGCEVIGSIA